MATAILSPAERAALSTLADDLRRVFGVRLRSLVAYGLELTDDQGVHSLALVDRLAFEDLAACVPHARRWTRSGLAVPLLLELEEFRRTLDVFPLEYGAIIRDHLLVTGDAPFADCTIRDEDTRRACESSAKSQLIHLREGYLETHGDASRIMQLIAASAAGFQALLANIVRLNGDAGGDIAEAAERLMGVPAVLVREVRAAASGTRSTIADPTALLARYIAAMERVWEYVDTWRR